MNFLSQYARVTLFLSITAFAASGISYYLDNTSLTGLLLVGALVMLAFSFAGFSGTRGFAYTVWILVAVSAAMFYPHAFQTIGDFQLKQVIVPFVQLTMFGMGAHMSFNDFKGVIMMPKGVVIGVFCHFIVMPLVAFGLSHLFPFPPEIAGGVILIGCVSSAMASNVMSYLAGANLALAITIGSVSTILSPFVTPFLMQWLGGQYVEIDVAHMMIDITKMIIIPVVAGFIFNMFYYGNTTRKMIGIQLLCFALVMIVTNVVLAYITNADLITFLISTFYSFLWFYFLPMIAAILLKRSQNITRQMIESSLSFAAMLGIVINTVVITASGRDNLLAVGGLLIVTCLIHNLAGLSLGYFLAMLFGLPEKDRRTIAFEVGMQNGGVATGLALQMGKVSTVGLASTIFGPLQNVTGSALANWFRKKDQRLAELTETDNKETLIGNLP
ncbi:bile acid:sodium symporter family protein [Dyadobacter sp. CY323]|uniref:bile acid:sodium symporter family protein n=1 Tax=Dyadobacter sp. CY323 TaxID=2907302 RepID=UPI001F2CC920|nr:bile acid:sodium symporter family protein [Dyadobacter sp. CY323]MCE6989707.1 bile acid:sodium symporter family protein [Dyadobacter sp. CY323]